MVRNDINDINDINATQLSFKIKQTATASLADCAAFFAQLGSGTRNTCTCSSPEKTDDNKRRRQCRLEYVLVNQTVANVLPRLDVLVVHSLVFFATNTDNNKIAF